VAAVAVVGNQQGNPDDLAAGQAVHLLTRSGQLLLHYGIDPPSSTQKMIPENHHSSVVSHKRLELFLPAKSPHCRCFPHESCRS